MMRLIPTRAAIIAALVAIGAMLLGWMRADAKKDAKRELAKEDLDHAKEITDRVSDSRADPDRVQPYEDAGYRD